MSVREEQAYVAKMDRIEELEAQLASAKQALEQRDRSYREACSLVSSMHAAALGVPEGNGPIRGVIEDVEDLRSDMEYNKAKYRAMTEAYGNLKKDYEALADQQALHVWQLREALEWAWTIIANAGQGNWEREHPDWKQAAERWRDEAFHPQMIKQPVLPKYVPYEVTTSLLTLARKFLEVIEERASMSQPLIDEGRGVLREAEALLSRFVEVTREVSPEVVPEVVPDEEER